MDTINFLYELTIENYIKKSTLENNIIFENLYTAFIASNYSYLVNFENIYNFIIYLHYYLDINFYKNPKNDIKDQVKIIKLNNRFKSEIKKLADSISKEYIKIVKIN